MNIKVIKNREDYLKSIEFFEELMAIDPEPDSENGEKLALLAKLIEDYESEKFPEQLPDPIEAIKFRMEQQGLKQSDLIPYIGSSSRVSEILSNKRPLTLKMIRALESGLGIPAKVLLKEVDDFKDHNSVNWEKFPLKEITRRGYLSKAALKYKDLESTIKSLFSSVGSFDALCGMLRKTSYRSVRPIDKYALGTWSAIVAKKAEEITDMAKFDAGNINLEFMQSLAKISVDPNWVNILIDSLKNVGIALVIEPVFPNTYLDGAVLIAENKNPVIGMTLRHDRLDNFWFTLMHELAHISLHSNKGFNLFYDDLDNADDSTEEIEADNLALEALVPQAKWEVSPAKIIPSSIAAKSLANELGIHPAIVAGKMRYEGGNYVYMNKLINESRVRKYFTNQNWK